jgi:hypothetical protein
MSHKLGKQCKVYYSSSLLTDEVGPSQLAWLSVKRVRDLTINADDDEWEKTDRESGGIKCVALTQTDLSIDFNIIKDAAEPSYVALRTAKLAKNEIALAIMDGDITVPGTEGWCANFVVPGWKEGQPLAEGIAIDVTIKPGSQPQSYIVS